MAISSSISEYLLFCTHKSATVVDRRCIFCNLCNLVKIKFCDNLSSPTSDTYSRSIFINQWKPHEGTNYKEHSGIFLLFLHTISYILYYYTSLIMVITRLFRITYLGQYKKYLTKLEKLEPFLTYSLTQKPFRVKK